MLGMFDAARHRVRESPGQITMTSPDSRVRDGCTKASPPCRDVGDVGSDRPLDGADDFDDALGIELETEARDHSPP
jgi:hypothetical protein